MIFLKNKNSGITIMEVVVAALILTMVVAGSLNSFLASSISCKTTDYTFIVINLIKNRIERLKGLDYNSLEQTAEVDTRLDKNGIPDVNGDFFRTTEVNTSYGTDLTEVTVSVNFLLRGEKRAQPIIIKTLFVNPE